MVAGVVALATIAAGVVASRVFHHDSRVEQALATLPQQTLVANFTDWSAVRDRLGPGVSSAAPESQRRTLLSRAYDHDFTTTSVLNVFDHDMASTYGWTVLDSEWEMYGQGRGGSVEVVRMPDGFDFAAAQAALTRLGYAEPDDHGVQVVDDQGLAAIAPGLTPQLTAIALLPDRHLIVTSDQAAYAGLTVDTIKGHSGALLDQSEVAHMAASLADTSVSALMDVGSYACVAAGFGQADPGEQALARDRIKAVGGVTRTDGLTRSIDASSALTVVMDFPSDDVASQDLAARQTLARGPAPEQGGTFDERFSVRTSEVVGRDIVMLLEPRTADTQLLTDLGRGGLLFASC